MMAYIFENRYCDTGSDLLVYHTAAMKKIHLQLSSCVYVLEFAILRILSGSSTISKVRLILPK